MSPHTEEQKQAFTNGQHCYGRGVDRGNCPYVNGHPLREAWLNGWDSSKENAEKTKKVLAAFEELKQKPTHIIPDSSDEFQAGEALKLDSRFSIG